jgi:glutathione-regulated potassium-efflux system ancillary protein KefC
MDVGHLLLAVASMMLITLVAVSLARRLQLGSIVALLLVGMLLGPHSPWPLFTGHIEELRAVGEVGVMLLLFAVGLDVQPRKLWSMRRLVFGYASIQYVVTVAAIVAFLFAMSVVGTAQWRTGLVVALALAMSSAAVPLPILRERHDEGSPHGRVVIASEIFQSLLLVPVLALIAVLGAGQAADAQALSIYTALRIVAVFAGIWFLGRYALPWALGIAARRLGPVNFALIVLAGVFLAGWAMDTLGISMALGAFMVGVLLSTSLYAEQVKAAVAPSRQVLLALFFVALGMAMNLEQLAPIAGEVLVYLPALLSIKFVLLFVLSRLFKLDLRSSLLAGLMMMPFDEIAYVILASASASGLLNERGYTVGLSVISLSFVVSPMLINLGYRWSERLVARQPRPAEPLPQVDDQVVVFGCGHVGRGICTLLARAEVAYVAFDLNVDDVVEAKRAGHNAFYGDLNDPTLLDALALARARLAIVATPQFDVTRRMLDNLRDFYQHVPVIAAVQYLAQRDELQRTGAAQVVALMPEGTIAFGRHVLDRLGLQPEHAGAIVGALQSADYAALRGVAH